MLNSSTALDALRSRGFVAEPRLALGSPRPAPRKSIPVDEHLAARDRWEQDLAAERTENARLRDENASLRAEIRELRAAQPKRRGK